MIRVLHDDYKMMKNKEIAYLSETVIAGEFRLPPH